GSVGIRGGTLSGTGTINGNVSNFAQVLPGLSPGVLTINGNYTQTPSGVLVLEFNGYGASAGYDQLRVNGTVDLAGTLTLVGNFTPIAGDLFILMDNDLAEAITGTFDGLGEGAYLVSNGRAFHFSYQGGTGNDLVAVLTNTAPLLDPIGNQTVDEG